VLKIDEMDPEEQARRAAASARLDDLIVEFGDEVDLLYDSLETVLYGEPGYTVGRPPTPEEQRVLDDGHRRLEAIAQEYLRRKQAQAAS